MLIKSSQNIIHCDEEIVKANFDFLSSLNLFNDYERYRVFSFYQFKMKGGGINFRMDFNNADILWMDIITDGRSFLRPSEFTKALHYGRDQGFKFIAGKCINPLCERWLKKVNFQCVDKTNKIYSIKVK